MSKKFMNGHLYKIVKYKKTFYTSSNCTGCTVRFDADSEQFFSVEYGPGIDKEYCLDDRLHCFSLHDVGKKLFLVDAMEKITGYPRVEVEVKL